MLGREPTLIVEAVRSCLMVAMVFGLPLTDEQQTTLLIAVSAILAVVNRGLVSPVESE